MTTAPWRDPALPAAARVDDLLARMTLEEKTAQLYGVWVGADTDGDGVAPHQHDMVDRLDWERADHPRARPAHPPVRHRPGGPGASAPRPWPAPRPDRRGEPLRHPGARPRGVPGRLRRLGRHRLPGPAGLGRDLRPGAGRGDGRPHRPATCASVGVHQGLAPVLDVVRDPRWGRVEETIGEDPYLVGTIGTAYVRGLESAGIVATLKHFAGLLRLGRRPQPRAGARRAPGARRRHPAAVRDGAARGRRPLGDARLHRHRRRPGRRRPELLTGLLRDTWGFTGTVVADYFGIGFLETLHRVAGEPRRGGPPGPDGRRRRRAAHREAATATRWSPPSATGAVAEELIDRAPAGSCSRSASSACSDAGLARPERTGRRAVDLDSAAEPGAGPAARRASRGPAGQPGRRPAAGRRPAGSRSSGPAPTTRWPCSAATPSPATSASHHPDVPIGIEIPTVLDALRAELPDAKVDVAQGCDVDGRRTPSGFAEAVARAAGGGRVRGRRSATGPGLFGRGTSGEGCDAADLRLPGRPGRAAGRAARAPGRPVVLVLLTGRPYALGRWRGPAGRAWCRRSSRARRAARRSRACCRAGSTPPAGCRSACPSGPGGQPWTYLQPPLGLASEVSNLDPTPLYPFGHGLLVHVVRLGGRRRRGRRAAHRRRPTARTTVGDRPQHRRPRGRRGGPALPARPGGLR